MKMACFNNLSYEYDSQEVYFQFLSLFKLHALFVLYLCVWSVFCLQCKNVISRLRKRTDREGPQIIPLLTDLWKRIESSGCMGGTEDNLFDLPEIDIRLDNQEYAGLMEFVSDVQLMLRSAVQYYGFSLEVQLHIFFYTLWHAC